MAPSYPNGAPSSHPSSARPLRQNAIRCIAHRPSLRHTDQPRPSVRHTDQPLPSLRHTDQSHSRVTRTSGLLITSSPIPTSHPISSDPSTFYSILANPIQSHQIPSNSIFTKHILTISFRVIPSHSLSSILSNPSPALPVSSNSITFLPIQFIPIQRISFHSILSHPFTFHSICIISNVYPHPEQRYGRNDRSPVPPWSSHVCIRFPFGAPRGQHAAALFTIRRHWHR